MWCVGALLVAVMAAFQVYDVLRRRVIVIETTERSYAGLARAMADRTRGIVLAADVAVRETAADAASATQQTGVLHGRLRDRVSALPQIRSLFVLGAEGKLVASAGAPQASASLEQAFRAARRAQPGGIDLPRVLPLQAGREWTLAIWREARPSRRVALAFLDLGYYARSVASLDLGPGGEVSLWDGEGHLLARAAGASTMEPVELGEGYGGTKATIVERRRRHGADATVAVQALDDFPLFVLAAVDNATVLQPWNVQAMHSAVRTSLFCLSVLLLLTLVLRQLKRRASAEAGLRVQTTLLDELFDSAPEAIVMLDADGRVTRVNREFSRMFGFNSAQSCARPLIDLIVPDDLKQDARRMAAAVREGRHTSVETIRMRSDGARLHVSELGAPIAEAAGGVVSYAIYRDITERRLAEAERTKLESRLRQAEKLEAVGTMAGGIAHDFNSIITAILGYGEMARRVAPRTGALTRYVDNVLAAASRAKALVDQILTYSRTARSKRVVVNPRLIVLEAMELVRASLPAAIHLEVQLSTERASVFADPTQLHQVVMNLCTNAVQAMPAGGTMGIALEPADVVDERALSHGLLPAGRYLRLTVRDTGCGMDAEVLERIFEPFFTTKKWGHGTGLGLALVQGIVSELGGAIDVASRPGSGSTFQLYLPCSDAIAPTAAAALPKGAGQQVLVVEDETPLMLLVEEMLATLGYEPAGFTHPTEGLDEFRAEPSRFDAVVLDYLMPDMTGTELTKRLRGLRPDIPIVLVSGYEGPLLLHEAVGAGIEHVITKPLNLQQLAETMSKALASSARS